MDIFDQFFQKEDNLNSIVDLEVDKKGTLFGYAFGGLENKEQYYSSHLVVDVPCKLEELFKGCSKPVSYHRKVSRFRGRC